MQYGGWTRGVAICHLIMLSGAAISLAEKMMSCRKQIYCWRFSGLHGSDWCSSFQNLSLFICFPPLTSRSATMCGWRVRFRRQLSRPWSDRMPGESTITSSKFCSDLELNAVFFSLDALVSAARVGYSQSCQWCLEAGRDWRWLICPYECWNHTRQWPGTCISSGLQGVHLELQSQIDRRAELWLWSRSSKKIHTYTHTHTNTHTHARRR